MRRASLALMRVSAVLAILLALASSAFATDATAFTEGTFDLANVTVTVPVDVDGLSTSPLAIGNQVVVNFNSDFSRPTLDSGVASFPVTCSGAPYKIEGLIVTFDIVRVHSQSSPFTATCYNVAHIPEEFGYSTVSVVEPGVGSIVSVPLSQSVWVDGTAMVGGDKGLTATGVVLEDRYGNSAMPAELAKLSVEIRKLVSLPAQAALVLDLPAVYSAGPAGVACSLDIGYSDVLVSAIAPKDAAEIVDGVLRVTFRANTPATLSGNAATLACEGLITPPATFTPATPAALTLTDRSATLLFQLPEVRAYYSSASIRASIEPAFRFAASAQVTAQCVDGNGNEGKRAAIFPAGAVIAVGTLGGASLGAAQCSIGGVALSAAAQGADVAAKLAAIEALALSYEDAKPSVPSIRLFVLAEALDVCGAPLVCGGVNLAAPGFAASIVEHAYNFDNTIYGTSMVVDVLFAAYESVAAASAAASNNGYLTSIFDSNPYGSSAQSAVVLGQAQVQLTPFGGEGEADVARLEYVAEQGERLTLTMPRVAGVVEALNAAAALDSMPSTNPRAALRLTLGLAQTLVLGTDDSTRVRCTLGDEGAAQGQGAGEQAAFVLDTSGSNSQGVFHESISFVTAGGYARISPPKNAGDVLVFVCVGVRVLTDVAPSTAADVISAELALRPTLGTQFRTVHAAAVVFAQGHAVPVLGAEDVSVALGTPFPGADSEVVIHVGAKRGLPVPVAVSSRAGDVVITGTYSALRYAPHLDASNLQCTLRAVDRVSGTQFFSRGVAVTFTHRGFTVTTRVTNSVVQYAFALTMRIEVACRGAGNTLSLGIYDTVSDSWNEVSADVPAAAVDRAWATATAAIEVHAPGVTTGFEYGRQVVMRATTSVPRPSFPLQPLAIELESTTSVAVADAYKTPAVAWPLSTVGTFPTGMPNGAVVTAAFNYEGTGVSSDVACPFGGDTNGILTVATSGGSGVTVATPVTGPAACTFAFSFTANVFASALPAAAASAFTLSKPPAFLGADKVNLALTVTYRGRTIMAGAWRVVAPALTPSVTLRPYGGADVGSNPASFETIGSSFYVYPGRRHALGFDVGNYKSMLTAHTKPSNKTAGHTVAVRLTSGPNSSLFDLAHPYTREEYAENVSSNLWLPAEGQPLLQPACKAYVVSQYAPNGAEVPVTVAVDAAAGYTYLYVDAATPAADGSDDGALYALGGVNSRIAVQCAHAYVGYVPDNWATDGAHAVAVALLPFAGARAEDFAGASFTAGAWDSGLVTGPGSAADGSIPVVKAVEGVALHAAASFSVALNTPLTPLFGPLYGGQGVVLTRTASAAGAFVVGDDAAERPVSCSLQGVALELGAVAASQAVFYVPADTVIEWPALADVKLVCYGFAFASAQISNAFSLTVSGRAASAAGSATYLNLPRIDVDFGVSALAPDVHVVVASGTGKTGAPAMLWRFPRGLPVLGAKAGSLHVELGEFDYYPRHAAMVPELTDNVSLEGEGAAPQQDVTTQCYAVAASDVDAETGAVAKTAATLPGGAALTASFAQRYGVASDAQRDTYSMPSATLGFTNGAARVRQQPFVVVCDANDMRVPANALHAQFASVCQLGTDVAFEQKHNASDALAQGTGCVLGATNIPSLGSALRFVQHENHYVGGKQGVLAVTVSPLPAPGVPAGATFRVALHRAWSFAPKAAGAHTGSGAGALQCRATTVAGRGFAAAEIALTAATSPYASAAEFAAAVTWGAANDADAAAADRRWFAVTFPSAVAAGATLRVLCDGVIPPAQTVAAQTGLALRVFDAKQRPVLSSDAGMMPAVNDQAPGADPYSGPAAAAKTFTLARATRLSAAEIAALARAVADVAGVPALNVRVLRQTLAGLGSAAPTLAVTLDVVETLAFPAALLDQVLATPATAAQLTAAATQVTASPVRSLTTASAANAPSDLLDVAQRGAGEWCETNDDCLSGSCVDGACTASASAAPAAAALSAGAVAVAVVAALVALLA